MHDVSEPENIQRGKTVIKHKMKLIMINSFLKWIRILNVINHCIFRNLKAFPYGEEHQMYFCKEVLERPEKKIFWIFSG